MRSGTWLLASALAMGAFAAMAAPRAVAQAHGGGQADAPPAAYREAIELAVSEFQAHAYAESRAAFQRAHDIYPNARTLRGLGMVEYELKHYKQCAEYLEQALASPVRPLRGKLRAGTEALLDTARGYLVTVRLDLAPTDAAVFVDGTEVALEDGATVVQVGDHTLEARAEGYVAMRRQISVTGGRDETLRIHLIPLPAPAARAAERSPARPGQTGPTSRDDSDGAFYEQWWFWTAAGVVVAGAAVTGVMLTTGGDERAPGTQLEGALKTMALELR